MEKKICSKCGEEKELSEFNIRKDTKNGFRADCKLCRKNIIIKIVIKKENAAENIIEKTLKEQKISTINID